MPRFFVAAGNIFGGVAYIDGKDAEHLKVLRVKQGEKIVVSDGNGQDYVCRVTEVGKGETRAEVLETRPSEGEPSIRCGVYAAYPKGDKAETIIQKSVELGASEVVFFPSERCVSRPDPASLVKKLDRWAKVAREAAMQSQRGSVPAVRALASFEQAMAEAAKAELPLFLYEGEREQSLREALKGAETAKTAALVSGSEGGFSPEEAEAARAAGLCSVSLGPRILRCETAPLAALSAVMLMSGNM